jgi:hypothetical protein
MLLGRRKNAKRGDFSISIENTNLTSSENMRLLGVTLSPDREYPDHVCSILKKSGFALRLSRSVVNIISPSEKWLMWNSYILPHLLYCGALLVGLNKTQMARLTRFVKVTFRTLQLTEDPVSLPEIYMKRGLLILHQAMHSGHPVNFANMISKSSSQCQLRGSNRIILPHMKTSFATRSTFILTAKAWNALPPTIEKYKTSSSTASFKAALDRVDLK